MAFERVVTKLEKALAAITNRISNFGQLTLMAMVLLIVVDVCLRRFFNSPLSWSLEIVQVMLVVVVFFSVAYCAVRGGHISIDALVCRFPERLQAGIDIATSLFGVAVFAAMCWASISSAQHYMEVKRVTGILPIPIYPFILAVALGSLLMTLAVLVHLLKAVTRVVSR